jgi:cyclopropane fatty-acyl-phospholipid synthase-like methyltransferase
MSNVVRGEDESSMRYAPAADRNKEPLVAVLSTLLPQRGAVLEIASGTGQHVVHFARSFPSLSWQPSEADEGLISSIRGHAQCSGCSNIEDVIQVNVHAPVWSVDIYDAIIAINMIHIAPWSATHDLFRGGTEHLKYGGTLIMYGPYRFFGYDHAESNRLFDQRLRAQNAAWGIRNLESIGQVAAGFGFALSAAIPMPANNHVLVFKRYQPEARALTVDK